MVGPRSLALKPLKVQKCVTPDLKALMCVRLREKNQECGNFLRLCCVLLKIGVFDENLLIACCTLSLDLQLINFLSLLTLNLISFSHTL